MLETIKICLSSIKNGIKNSDDLSNKLNQLNIKVSESNNGALKSFYNKYAN